MIRHDVLHLGIAFIPRPEAQFLDQGWAATKVDLINYYILNDLMLHSHFDLLIGF